MRLTAIILVLCITVGLSQICVTRVLSEQAIELIQNPGFETGDFSNWSADSNCFVRRGSYYKQAHSGEYCARVGTDQSSGTLSQTCKIPAKSAATLSFWYSVEKGSTLEARLVKSKDGSLIKPWSLTGEAWKIAKLDLDLSLANEEVTIEFTGTGHVEEVRIPVYDPVLKIYYYYTRYYYYYAYVDDVSLVSRVVAYEVRVEISGLPQGLPTKVLVDGVAKDRVGAERAAVFTFKLGESHTIEVEQFIAAETGVRYACASNSASFSSDSNHGFVYKKQYFLKVESSFGSYGGEGWHGDGEDVAFSVSPTSLPMSGLLGSLGAKYVFDRWSGDSSITTAEGSILMNGPKRVSAIWKEDYSQPIVVLVVLATIGGSGVFLFIRRVRKGRAVGLKQVFKYVGPAKEEAKPKGEEVAKIVEAPTEDRERYLKRLEELKAQGKITDKVYERLKKKYQTEKKQ